MIKKYLDKSLQHYSIAFYNLENLFDTKDDPKTLDDDFTETADRNWNEKRFRKKNKKIGKVISQLGYSEIGYPPVIIGLAEVENEFVLRELSKSKFLKNKGYQIVHFDSPDERGIDTALLYREKYFEVLEKKAITVYLKSEYGTRDFTRDILYVKGRIGKETLHILVNHWPSRRAGIGESDRKRISAALKNREVIQEIHSNNPNAKIIIMGDYNDGPNSKSIQQLKGTDFFNPMELLNTKNEGSLNYKGDWYLFDQIIISNNFLRQQGNSFRFIEAKIFNPPELQEYKGKFKGNPFRTFVGKKYLGGTSDHFPVYALFSVDINK